MSDKRYNVVLTGETKEGVDKAQAVEAFAKLFKINNEKAEATLAKAPVAVKKEVDETTGFKFVSAIEKIGVQAKLTRVKNTSEASVDNTPPDTPTVVNPIINPEKYLGWTYTIEGRPDYSYLTVQIPANKTLKVEASSMAAMDTNIQMKTKLKGGFGRFLTGESLFINEFTAANGAGEIGIAPGTPGDLTHQYLDGDTIFLQNSAYVASTMNVNLETKWQGMVKGFFSGESLFLIRCSGTGDLWFNTYGAIIEIDVNEDYVVDTGNIVAFTEGLDYTITKVGGYKSLFFSGEGFVCRFTGKGRVWIQTRSAGAFTNWAHWFRPVQKSN